MGPVAVWGIWEVLAAAAAAMTSETAVTVGGAVVAGTAGAVVGNEIAKSRAQTKLNDITVADVCLPCASACAALAGGVPGSKYRGGAHSAMQGPTGDGLDSHHTPSAAASYLPRPIGPAIQMDPLDHAMTASNGGGSAAYIADQRSLISGGNFMGAVAMDAADIRLKFGNKYDDALTQMAAYTACLKLSGVVR
jgi:hypothetical protein